MRRFILLSFLALPAFAVDEQPTKLEALPEAPDPILPAQSGETLEPDITITRKNTKTIEEYRRGGRLYMIKVNRILALLIILLIMMVMDKWMYVAMTWIMAIVKLICGKYSSGNQLLT